MISWNYSFWYYDINLKMKFFTLNISQALENPSQWKEKGENKYKFHKNSKNNNGFLEIIFVGWFNKWDGFEISIDKFIRRKIYQSYKNGKMTIWLL